MTKEIINDYEPNAFTKTDEELNLDLNRYDKHISWGFITISNCYLIICFVLVINLKIDFASVLGMFALILCLITWYFVIRYHYNKPLIMQSSYRYSTFTDIELFVQRFLGIALSTCLLCNFFILMFK